MTNSLAQSFCASQSKSVHFSINPVDYNTGLGNNTFPTPPPNLSVTYNTGSSSVRKRRELNRLLTTARFLLRSEASNRGLLPFDLHRTSKCGDVPIKRDMPSIILKNGRAYWSNVARCGCAWICPICAAAKEEVRRSRVSEIMEKSYRAGKSVAMITFTIPHTRDQSLMDVYNNLKAAQSRFISQTPVERFRRKCGFWGRVMSLELMYGSNGWHPHSHELWVIDNVDPDSESSFLDFFSRQWVNALINKGIIDPNDYSKISHVMEHGVDIKFNVSTGDYLAKRDAVGWGADSEITRKSHKTGRLDSLSPFDMLRKFESTKSARYAKLFINFVDFLMVKTRWQFSISRSFKNHFSLSWSSCSDELDVPSDTPISTGDVVSPDYTHVMSFDYCNWYAVRQSRSHVLLLELAESGGLKAIKSWLDDNGYFNEDGSISRLVPRWSRSPEFALTSGQWHRSIISD